MSNAPNFDLTAAHRFFSTDCFNRAWDLIEKPNRTPDEDEEMILLSLASTWHWSQREDCEPTHLSVGYWQTSRIFSILGKANAARRYGQLSLDRCQGDDFPPFYSGYAYEALARAESVAGNAEKMEEYQNLAREMADAVEDPDSRKMLLDDLDTIKS
jgi:hypothetical protein